MRRLSHLEVSSPCRPRGCRSLGGGPDRRRGDVLILNVRPRNWLNPGNVVPVGVQVNPASPLGQTCVHMVLPPWQNMRDRFGESVLPDPIGGPFIGARNPIGPVDFVAPNFLR